MENLTELELAQWNEINKVIETFWGIPSKELMITYTILKNKIDGKITDRDVYQLCKPTSYFDERYTKL